jgi:predicted MFS family arabinose efflux permease
LINALSYIAVLGALLLMHGFRESHVGKPQTREGSLAVLRRHPRLLMLIALAGWVSASGWSLLALLPAFAENVLGMMEGGYSTMLSSVGVGALLAALTAATFGNERSQRWHVLGGLCSVCLGLFGLSQARTLFLASGCCAMFGFGMILFFAAGQGAVQMGAANEHRGKIMGFWAMMLSGGAPIGNLIFGPAADVWGVTPVIAVQGLMMGVATIAYLIRRV